MSRCQFSMGRAAVSSLWAGTKKYKNKNKTEAYKLDDSAIRPKSASAHRENAQYARLPVQPWKYII